MEITTIFGVDTEYYLTIPDPKLDNCNTISDKVCIRVLILDNNFQTGDVISVIQIPKKEFPIKKSPRVGDIVIIMKKFYQVYNYETYTDFFKVELKVYCKKD